MAEKQECAGERGACGKSGSAQFSGGDGLWVPYAALVYPALMHVFDLSGHTNCGAAEDLGRPLHANIDVAADNPDGYLPLPQLALTTKVRSFTRELLAPFFIVQARPAQIPNPIFQKLAYQWLKISIVNQK